MNRLRELRENKKETLKELATEIKEAEMVEITPDALAKYERGDREPTPKMWKVLANFFNVSVPYLLGAYSQDEILEVLQNWYLKLYIDTKNEIETPMILARRQGLSIIDDYLITRGVIPWDVKKDSILISKKNANDFNFWKTNFKDLFFYSIALQWLVKKPMNVAIDDIKKALLDALNGALGAYMIDVTKTTTDTHIKQDNLLVKRYEFLEDHTLNVKARYIDGYLIIDRKFDWDK